MLKKLLDHKVRVFFFAFLVLLLALVRNYETVLFYDPFLSFFKSGYANSPLPGFDSFRLFLSLSSRYFLNTAISLAIIYAAFKEIELVKFSLLLYLVFFIVLIVAFFLIIYIFGGKNNLALFYVRRFLIQPLFVILFVPAFYYQNRMIKK